MKITSIKNPVTDNSELIGLKDDEQIVFEVNNSLKVIVNLEYYERMETELAAYRRFHGILGGSENVGLPSDDEVFDAADKYIGLRDKTKAIKIMKE